MFGIGGCEPPQPPTIRGRGRRPGAHERRGHPWARGSHQTIEADRLHLNRGPAARQAEPASDRGDAALVSVAPTAGAAARSRPGGSTCWRHCARSRGSRLGLRPPAGWRVYSARVGLPLEAATPGFRAYATTSSRAAGAGCRPCRPSLRLADPEARRAPVAGRPGRIGRDAPLQAVVERILDQRPLCV
jgi:hypothetical protein